MIRDRLIPALKTEFSGWEISFDEPPLPIATFPACQEAVGKAFISDDGDQAIVSLENISQGHFNPNDETQTLEEREQILKAAVFEFLRALFSDRGLLNTTPDTRVGGWSRLDFQVGHVELPPSVKYFLGSKPDKP